MQSLQGGRRNYFHPWTKFALALSLLLIFSTSAAWGFDVLFVVGKAKLNGGDRAIKNRLESFGLTVTVMDDDDVQDHDVINADKIDLIFISKTVYSKKVGSTFAGTEIPVICSEPWLFDDLGMTGRYENTDYGYNKWRRKTSKLQIIDPDHPLAAGLEGWVKVSCRRFKMGWGVPSDDAIKIASLKNASDKFAIFAYEADSNMPGLDKPAPARRVGLFLDNHAARRLTSDGEALLDAAIEWTLGIERHQALMITGSHWLRSGDRELKKRLEQKGFKVTIKSDRSSRTADAIGKDLIVLSESAYSKRVTTKFRNVEVPVICTEPYLFDDMGMTGPYARRDYGHARRQKHITIIDPDHPLTAGLKGDVKVSYRSFTMGWGVPHWNAALVATVPDHPDLATIFAYEPKDAMFGLRASSDVPFEAPARRVGLFLFRNTGRTLTPDGWALFDAAVDWAFAAPEAVPEVEFWADVDSIEEGQEVTLNWETRNADIVEIELQIETRNAYTVGVDQYIGPVEVNGSIVLQPDATTTYTLTASGTGGTVSASVRVEVLFPSPSIVFTATPEVVNPEEGLAMESIPFTEETGFANPEEGAAQESNASSPDVAFIKPGESAKLEWTSSSAEFAVIAPDIGGVNLEGALSVSPPASTTYTLMMAGPGGTVSAKAKVVVEDFFAIKREDHPVEFKTLTFTPDGSPNYYSTCQEDATEFPVDPAGGTLIPLNGNLSYAGINLEAGAQILFYGQTYPGFYAGRYGYI
ncbi:MAG: hypothetical protein KJO34_18240, partial [Deltaproteobacteria bacterium]|nr:hypothetical protein [Deltaproteobacteria bacterium]